MDAALASLLTTFGQPHRHAGKSVRVLRPPIYEVRAGRDLRLVFVRDGDVLRLIFAGDHDEVASFLKNAR